MADFDWSFTYPSKRAPVLARNIVATSQPLAAQAGLRMLAAGGNAVDAALASAITLTVVEPNMNGIGSDAFAILWDGKELIGLNASGRAPAAWTLDYFGKYSEMPKRGWDSVTVPGAVSAWVALSRRFGKLAFETLFEPAIGYAREGFFVSPITATNWANRAEDFVELPDFQRDFMPRGRAPHPGELFRFPDQAATLELIAESNGTEFYQGRLAQRIAAHARATGGAITEEDLAAHEVDWVAPIAIDYRGFRLHEIPPNGQGIAALMTLGILQHHDLASLPPESADSLHLQLEAMKLAFADVYAHVGDPGAMRHSAQQLLAPDYLAARAKQIQRERAQQHACGIPREGGTVYLTAADASGMMVSFIQSNYMGFGSGIVVPNTGISLQNRGHGFNLDPASPNCVAPRKRPLHTIIPGFVTRDGAPLMSFGVMGGAMQPQGHTQVMLRIVDYKQNPQAALDAPRWQVAPDQSVLLEHGFAPEVVAELRQRGHEIQDVQPPSAFGGGQIIYKLDSGYLGASEPRKDGQAVGF